MHYTRRNILKKGAFVAGGIGLLHPANTSAQLRPHLQASLNASDIQDPHLKVLIQTAVDAATNAGASYADARLSHVASMQVDGPSPLMKEHMAFGVRVIANGYWGFAASPVWSVSEASRLGRAAVEQAKANRFSDEGPAVLAPIVSPQSGHWTMPVKDNPFLMAYEEIWDYMSALGGFVGRLQNLKSSHRMIIYKKISKAFGSSIGQYTTQQLFSSGGTFSINLEDSKGAAAGGNLNEVAPAGLGFEHLRDQPLREKILLLHEDLMHMLELPKKPWDVGRYDTLCDGRMVAELVSRTIGHPTQIDTALGFEADAGGTGFIDPIDMLGSYRLGSPLLNVSGDRSAEGSVGRVRWDDEGISPVKVDLVKDGIVTNMQCNREGAALITDYFKRTGQTLQSHGCAYARTAMDVPMVHNMDLSITPAPGGASIDSLRRDMQKGIEIQSPLIDVDFQAITGTTLFGMMFEIKDGKRVARYEDGSIIFRTPELWSNLIALGGESSRQRFSFELLKGQPIQVSTDTVFAVPAVFKDMTVMRTK